MSRAVDNLIAYRFLTMIVTPFKRTDAYKLGIIDEDGNNLIPKKELETTKQKNAYTALHRLAFNIKKLIAKIPGGKSMLASLTAALVLLRESEGGLEDFEQELRDILDEFDTEKFLPPDEVALIKEFLIIQEDMNVTGDAVSSKTPVIKGKHYSSFVLSRQTFDKIKKKKKGIMENLSTEVYEEKMLMNYLNNNPDGVAVARSGESYSLLTKERM